MAPSPILVNMDHALCSPSVAQLIALLGSLCSTGLWKLGSCFERLLDLRTHHAGHYNPLYFNRDGAICVAYGIASKVVAATLESTGIQYLKYTLGVGVNSKDSDDVPHGGYSAFNLAALYLVPVVLRITTQAQFFQEHVSYYMQRKHDPSTKEAMKEERKLLKEREEEDKLYGDKPKFVTSAYKDKLAEDQKYVQEMEARELSQSDMKSTGMLGFYGGLLKTSVPASSFPPATSEAEGLPGAPVSGSHPPQRFSSQVRAVQSVNDGQGSPAGHTQTRLTSQDDPDTMTGTGDNIEVVVEGTREVEDAAKDMDAMKRAERMVLVEAARARYFERVRLKQAGK